jgi:hypothetical protein
MKPYFHFAITCLLWGAFSGCATSTPPPPHHGAFFRTSWQPLYTASHDSRASAGTPKKRTARNTADSVDAFRATIVAASLQLYRESESADHYGAVDIVRIFDRAGCSRCFAGMRNVPALVKEANRLHAYRSTDKPQPGDLILFHNQVDRNRNGQSDDWYTGVGVIIESGRHTYIAITRTEGRLRKVYITPDGPMVRTYNGAPHNSFVKIAKPHDPVDAEYLAGQLYAGFIDTGIVYGRYPSN